MLRGLRGATGATVPCAFKQIPAIGHLDGLLQRRGNRAAVPAAALAGDNLGAGTRAQLGFHRRGSRSGSWSITWRRS